MNYLRMFIPNAYIFITIVAYKRKQILIENIEYLRESFKQTLQKYQFEIIAIVASRSGTA